MRSLLAFVVTLHLAILFPASSFAETQTWALDPGFNFKALTVTPGPAASTADLFATNGGIASIFTFDPTLQVFQYQLRLQGGGLFGAPFALEPGRGYAVNCSAPTTLTFDGPAQAVDSKTALLTGFNLVGLASLGGLGARSVVSADPRIVSIFRWAAADAAFRFVLRLAGGTVFGDDFTLESGSGYFVRFDGSLPAEGTIENTFPPEPTVAIEGNIELPAGSAVQASALKVLTATDERPVSADATFTSTAQATLDAPQVLLVTDAADVPLLLSYELPGTGGAFAPKLRTRRFSPRRSTGNNPVANAGSTALAVCMINPLLLNSTVHQKRQVAEAVLANPEFPNLTALIEQKFKANPSALLDGAVNPDIYRKAADITMDVLIRLYGTDVSSSPAAPAPNRIYRREAELVGMSDENSQNFRIENWKTSIYLVDVYQVKNGTFQLVDAVSHFVVEPLGGIFDKVFDFELGLKLSWNWKEWVEFKFGAAVPKGTDIPWGTMNPLDGLYKFVIYDTNYTAPDTGRPVAWAGGINTCVLTLKICNLVIDLGDNTPDAKTLLQKMFHWPGLWDTVRDKSEGIIFASHAGDWGTVGQEIVGLFVETDILKFILIETTKHYFGVSKEKLLRIVTSTVLKNVITAISPAAVERGFSAAAVFLFIADWVRDPHVLEYWDLNGTFTRERPVPSVLSMLDNYSVNSGDLLDLAKTVSPNVLYEPAGVRKVADEVTWRLLQGEGAVSGTTFQAPTVTCSTQSLLNGAYTEGDLTISRNILVTTRGSSFDPAKPRKRLTAISTLPESITVKAGESYNLDDVGVNGTYEYYDANDILVNTTLEPIDPAKVRWIGGFQLAGAPGVVSERVFRANSGKECSGLGYGEEIQGTLLATCVEDGLTAQRAVTVNLDAQIKKFTVSPESWKMRTGGYLNLLDLVAQAEFGDGTTCEVKTTFDYYMKLVSGGGAFSASTGGKGFIYHAPDQKADVQLQLVYRQDGRDNTIDFPVTVLSDALSGITVSPGTISVSCGDTVNLRDLDITASFEDGSTLEVLHDIKRKDYASYAIVSGGGAIVGSIIPDRYRAPDDPGVGGIRVSYVEKGITRSVVVGVLVLPRLLTGISAATPLRLGTGTPMDLSLVTVTATYDNGTANVVTANLSWGIVSGGGALSGTVYTAPATPGNATLRVTCTENGRAQACDVSVAVESGAGDPTSPDGLYACRETMTRINGMEFPSTDSNEVQVEIAGTLVTYNRNAANELMVVPCTLAGNRFSGTREMELPNAGPTVLAVDGHFTPPATISGVKTMTFSTGGASYIYEYEFSGSRP